MYERIFKLNDVVRNVLLTPTHRISEHNAGVKARKPVENLNFVVLSTVTRLCRNNTTLTADYLAEKDRAGYFAVKHHILYHELDQVRTKLCNILQHKIDYPMAMVIPNPKMEKECEYKNELKNDLKNELKNDLKNELKNELKNDLTNELKNDLKTELKNDLNNELKNDLKNELKNDLKTDLKNDLKNEFKNDLKKEYKNDYKKMLSASINASRKADWKSNFVNNPKEFDDAIVNGKFNAGIYISNCPNYDGSAQSKDIQINEKSSNSGIKDSLKKKNVSLPLRKSNTKTFVQPKKKKPAASSIPRNIIQDKVAENNKINIQTVNQKDTNIEVGNTCSTSRRGNQQQEIKQKLNENTQLDISNNDIPSNMTNNQKIEVIKKLMNRSNQINKNYKIEISKTVINSQTVKIEINKKDEFNQTNSVKQKIEVFIQMDDEPKKEKSQKLEDNKKLVNEQSKKNNKVVPRKIEINKDLVNKQTEKNVLKKVEGEKKLEKTQIERSQKHRTEMNKNKNSVCKQPKTKSTNLKVEVYNEKQKQGEIDNVKPLNHKECVKILTDETVKFQCPKKCHHKHACIVEIDDVDNYSGFEMEIPFSFIRNLRHFIHDECDTLRYRHKYKTNSTMYKKRANQLFRKKQFKEAFHLANTDDRFTSFKALLKKLQNPVSGYPLAWISIGKSICERIMAIDSRFTMTGLILDKRVWQATLDVFLMCKEGRCNKQSLVYSCLNNKAEIDKRIRNMTPIIKFDPPTIENQLNRDTVYRKPRSLANEIIDTKNQELPQRFF